MNDCIMQKISVNKIATYHIPCLDHGGWNVFEQEEGSGNIFSCTICGAEGQIITVSDEDE